MVDISKNDGRISKFNTEKPGKFRAEMCDILQKMEKMCIQKLEIFLIFHG
jgi:hypothetical protein